jgi:hypothetical protein
MSARRVLTGALVATFLVVVSSIVYAGVVAARAPTGADHWSGTSYNVTFTETGLAAGTNWSVFVEGGGGGGHGGHHHPFATSNTSSIVLSLPNGSYRYFVLNVDGYDIVSGAQGTFNVSGATVGPIAVTFAKLVPYTVTFKETGLPAGTEWSVRLRGDDFGFDHGQGNGFERHDHGGSSVSSNNSTITFSLTNGSYSYRVHADGYFAENGSRGQFNVSGSGPSIAVTFVSFSAPRPSYNVTFSESGLAAGTNWSVRIVGGFGGFFGFGHHHVGETSNATQTIALPNGSYRYEVENVAGYSIADNGSQGTFNVSGGSPPTIHVVFDRLVPYTVTFTETGLPSGTNWSVVAFEIGAPWGGGSGPVFGASNGTTITLSLTNGSYVYRVLHVDGFTAGNTSYGTFNVSGASPPTIGVTFTPRSGGEFVPAAPVLARA